MLLVSRNEAQLRGVVYHVEGSDYFFSGGTTF